MDRYLSALQDAGLSEKEARVYMSILGLGRASAYAVAEKAGIKRPTTYVVLGELIKKGLVLKIPRAKKQNFIAVDPSEYIKNRVDKVTNAKHVLPELMTIAGNTKRKVNVTYYEGLKSVEKALFYGSDEVKGKELVGFFASAEDVSPELMDVFVKWGDSVAENNISVRGYAPEHTSMKKFRELDSSKGRTIKSLPYNEYSSKISIDMGETFVRIMMNADLQAVIIENPELAKTLRQIFEIVWKIR